ncbi:MAG: Gfo/Idh/MocA family oxidoreductase [Bacteroidota bacterium]
MEKLKIGVVGAGWVSQVIHLPLLKKMQDIELVAVSDRDKAKAKNVATRFGIQRFYGNLEEMLKFEDLSAVVICSSTDAHKEHAIMALEAGKDIFVEKPLARKFSEAKEIVATAVKEKRKLMVGMNNRFRPDVMVLRSIVEAGDLGKIFFVKAGWLKRINTDTKWMTKKEKSGGGVFIDLGIVMLDLSLWMMGYQDVKRATAEMYKHTMTTVEDSCVAWCSLANHATLSLEVSWTFHSENDFFYCDLIGTNGSASINPLRIYRSIDGNVVNLTPMKQDMFHNSFLKSYENELKHFFGAVRGLHPIISTGDEAVKRMEIVDAIYRSAKSGKEQRITKTK